MLSITFFSCDNNVEEEIPIPIGSEICSTDISFIDDVKPIIDSNCIRCHGGNQAPDLRTFDGIKNNANRVRTQVVTRRMPLGGTLTNEEIERIRCWIDNGALNN
ncbi:hypothetical protein GCM10022259_33380 [Aquimarina mytili]